MLVAVLLAWLGALAAWPAHAMPGAADGAMQAARQALLRRDGVDAEAELRRAMKKGAMRDEVAAWMGEARLLQDDSAGARQWLGPGRFAPSSRGHGFRMLGWLEMREGDLPAAGRAYDLALRSIPDEPGLWVDIARLRYAGGEQTQAIDASIRALRLDPRDPRALELRGQLVRDSHGPVAALPYFERALVRAPDDLPLLGEYAATLGDAGRAKAMLAITRRMLELSPGNARAFFLQSVLAARAGKDDLARRLLLRVDDGYRRVPAFLVLQGVLELTAGNTATAIDSFERLVHRQPDNRRAQLLLARALAQAGEHKEIVRRFAPVADRGDAPPYLLALVARAHEALGDRRRAAPLLDRAAAPVSARLEPVGGGASVEVLAARWNSGRGGMADAVAYVRQLLAQRRHADAVAVANAVRGRYPGSFDANLLAGDAILLAGDPRGALRRYDVAGSIRMSPALLRRMVSAQLALRMDHEAETLMAGYAQGNPRDTEAVFMLAKRAMEREDWRDAIGLLDRSAVPGGGARDPFLLAAQARARLGAGSMAGARDAGARAYALQRMNREATAAFGIVLAAEHEQAATGLLFKAQRMRAGISAASPPS